MDPLLSVLNKSATGTLSKADLGQSLTTSPTGGGPTGTRFHDLLAQKSNGDMQDMIDKTFDLNSRGPQSIAAEDIHLTVSGQEVSGIDGISGKAIETNGNTVMNLFSQVNGDFNRLNNMVDVINSGKRLSQQDLIGIQVFSSKAILGVEVFSRLFEQTAKAGMGMFQMQV